MTGADVALIVSAFGTVVTAIGGVYIAYTSRKSNQAVQQVHSLVNQAATDAKRYRAVLERALTAAGVPIPPDQSIDIVE